MPDTRGQPQKILCPCLNGSESSPIYSEATIDQTCSSKSHGPIPGIWRPGWSLELCYVMFLRPFLSNLQGVAWHFVLLGEHSYQGAPLPWESLDPRFPQKTFITSPASALPVVADWCRYVGCRVYISFYKSDVNVKHFWSFDPSRQLPPLHFARSYSCARAPAVHLLLWTL